MWETLASNTGITRQVSSMIPSPLHTVTLVTNIVFTWTLYCFARFWKVGTDGWMDVHTTCVKTITTTGSYCGSTEWINTSAYCFSRSLANFLVCLPLNFSEFFNTFCFIYKFASAAYKSKTWEQILRIALSWQLSLQNHLNPKWWKISIEK